MLAFNEDEPVFPVEPLGNRIACPQVDSVGADHFCFFEKAFHNLATDTSASPIFVRDEVVYIYDSAVSSVLRKNTTHRNNLAVQEVSRYKRPA